MRILVPSGFRRMIISFSGDENGPLYRGKQQSGQRIMKRLKIAFEKRAIQAETICQHISASPFPVLLCGDLNDTPVSYCYRQFNDLLYDAFVESGNGIGQTYVGEVPSNRIDYIFYDASFKSANFETHQVYHSDHKPVSCQLDLVR
jgi:endonuclease/exonuclease/phosphatase family metal-dependent hydrolase